MQLVSVAACRRCQVMPPPPCRGGVAADGAVGQRGRAVVDVYTPPPSPAELPLTVQLVSVAVPPSYRPPPTWPAELPLTVQLVSVVVP